MLRNIVLVEPAASKFVKVPPLSKKPSVTPPLRKNPITVPVTIESGRRAVVVHSEELISSWPRARRVWIVHLRESIALVHESEKVWSRGAVAIRVEAYRNAAIVDADHLGLARAREVLARERRVRRPHRIPLVGSQSKRRWSAVRRPTAEITGDRARIVDSQLLVKRRIARVDDVLINVSSLGASGKQREPANQQQHSHWRC